MCVSVCVCVCESILPVFHDLHHIFSITPGSSLSQFQPGPGLNTHTHTVCMSARVRERMPACVSGPGACIRVRACNVCVCVCVLCTCVCESAYLCTCVCERDVYMCARAWTDLSEADEGLQLACGDGGGVGGVRLGAQREVEGLQRLGSLDGEGGLDVQAGVRHVLP